MRKYFYLFTMATFVFVISGCNPYNNAGEGAATGGALGALAGGIIGHQSHDTGAGMLIGGAVGAVAGAAVGSQIQKPPDPTTGHCSSTGPVVVSQVPTTTYAGDTVTVNVPNTNGGYTAMVLKRSGNGYVGPKASIMIKSLQQLSYKPCMGNKMGMYEKNMAFVFSRILCFIVFSFARAQLDSVDYPVAKMTTELNLMAQQIDAVKPIIQGYMSARKQLIQSFNKG